MEDHSQKPKRVLGYNLDDAEDFIADAVKGYTPEKVKELADHNSETSNALYQSYVAKYPHTAVNDRTLMLHESRFKHVAAEHAGGERYFDNPADEKAQADSHPGIYENALTAVLYSARKNGCDLDALLRTVKEDIPGASWRPGTNYQADVVSAIEQAIKEIRM